MIFPKTVESFVQTLPEDEVARREWEEEQEEEAVRDREQGVVITEEMKNAFNAMLENMRVNKPNDYAALMQMFR